MEILNLVKVNLQIPSSYILIAPVKGTKHIRVGAEDKLMAHQGHFHTFCK